MTIANIPDDEPESLVEIFDMLRDKELTVTMTVEELLVLSTICAHIGGIPHNTARGKVDSMMANASHSSNYPLRYLIKKCYTEHHHSVLSGLITFSDNIREIFAKRTGK